MSRGRLDYLDELILMLKRSRHAIGHARIEATSLVGMDADRMLDGIVHDTRAKFDRDIIRKTEHIDVETTRRNIDTPDALHDEDGDFGVHECMVLTIALTHRGQTFDHDPEDLSFAHCMSLIDALTELTPACLLRLEVIWSPSAESDAMSKADMMAHYPELINVT